MLFDAVRYENPATELSSMKKDFVEIMLPIQQLSSRNIKEATTHSKFIKSFCRAYHCLCLEDKEYQANFESVSFNYWPASRGCHGYNLFLHSF